MHTEYQLRVDRSTWPVEKNIQNHANFSRMKEQEKNRSVSRTYPWVVGELKQGSDPHIRTIV